MTPPQISELAAYGQTSLLVRRGATVAGGDLGVKETGAGPVLTFRVWAGEQSRVGIGKRVFGDSLFLGPGAAAGNLFASRLRDTGATHGPLSSFPATMPSLPSLPDVTVGTSALQVTGTRTICPGRYKDVAVSADAVLRLQGGLYEVASLRILERGRVEILGPVQLRIKGQLRSRRDVFLGPAAQVAVTAKDFRIEISGQDASDTDEDPSEGGVRVANFGLRANVRAVVLARNGLLIVVKDSKLKGAVLAKNVIIGESSQITFEDGWAAAATLAPVCDDRNPCTSDTCNQGVCSRSNVSAGTRCASGDACTGPGVCNGAGQCGQGTPAPVDDGNPCTVDACDPATGVTHRPAPVGTSCSDGNLCNGTETCNASGSCTTSQPAPPIDDGNPCTVDACNPTAGVTHVPAPPGTTCSDGNICNGVEACNPTGQCIPGPSPLVDDGNPCTVDTCHPANGPVHTPVPVGTSCADGDLCNGNEVCNGTGMCAAGAPPVLEDGNVCTVDTCDPATGVRHEPAPSGASCGNGTVCDGLEICNGAGICVPGMPIVYDDGNPCTVDACDPVLGAIRTPVAAGTSCGQAQGCSGASACDGNGACIAGPPSQVDDGNPCTADACGSSGSPTHEPLPAGTPCADTNVCNGSEVCGSTGICEVGTPLPIDDGDPCTADACDPTGGVTHTPIPSCNPDPGTIAPPVDQTVATTVFDTTSFLYAGTNPIQQGVTPGVFTVVRAALVRGRVTTPAGDGIDGVRVDIAGRPEYGFTFTRSTGEFDLVVNGGGQLTVRFAKAGFISVDRKIDVLWGASAYTEDTVLRAYDGQVTEVSSGAATIQVARGSVSSDTSGSRQATLLFPPGTQAVMTVGGTTQPLGTLHVRATEFTVGDAGFAAMPAPLPDATAYTYAVELSVDEAVAAGASEVQFSTSVSFYVENFLNFPVGTIVPVGFYDRAARQWVPSENGKIIRIISVAGGIATVDSNGDSAADDAATLAQLGISDAERQRLAGLYTAGQTLWRMRTSHFSAWDCNWGIVPPDDAISCPDCTPEASDKTKQDPCKKSGSIIECENQVLGEEVGIAGTPYTLNYRSNRTEGYRLANQLEIPLSGPTLPDSLQTIVLRVTVAGRQTLRAFAPLPNQRTTFLWDGRDAYDRKVQGTVPVIVEIGYSYRAKYGAVSRFGYDGRGESITGDSMRRDLLLWKWYSTQLSPQIDPKATGLGGWTIDPNHVYDLRRKAVYFGSGDLRFSDGAIGSIVEDVGPGAAAEAAPDGSLYFTDASQLRIFRRAPDGTTTLVAGTGGNGYSGDGGPATAAQIWARVLSYGPDGSLFVLDVRSVIRRIRPDGIIERIAGIPNDTNIGAEGGLATQTAIGLPGDMAAAPDGSVYIVASGPGGVRKVDPAGIITSVPQPAFPLRPISGLAVGSDGSIFVAEISGGIHRHTADGKWTLLSMPGPGGSTADGVASTEASLTAPRSLAVARDGTLYIAELGANRIRYILPSGLIFTLAGNGISGLAGDGGPALGATLSGPVDLSIGSDDSVYFVNAINPARIRRVSAALPKSTGANFILPAASGGEVYAFDRSGRHLKTFDALLGSEDLAFTYGANGVLAQLRDVDANVVTIEHDSSGNPTAIVGPFGHRTGLSVDGNGFLNGITNPNGEQISFSYTPNGLLTSMTDGRGATSQYVYDSLGRLESAGDRAGGAQTLTRTKLSNGFQVVHRTPLGRATTLKVETQPSGTERRTTIFPSGLSATVDFQTNATQVTRLPSGTRKESVLSADPRWRMAAPLASEFISTPGGLTMNLATSRQVTLSDSSNPMSLVSSTETTTIAGAPFTTTFTAATRTAVTTSPLGRTATVVFDAKGHVTSSVTSGIAPMQITYDAQGRPTVAAQGGRTETLTYDGEGNLATVTDARGQTLEFAYDTIGQMTSQTFADGRVVTFAYDENGNVTRVTPPGRPVHVMDHTAMDALSSYNPPDIGLTAHATTYGYNADHQLTTVSRPDGKQIVLGYDVAGRLATTTEPLGTTTLSYSATTGKLSQIVTFDNQALTFGYDGDLRTSMTFAGAIAAAVGWTYDSRFLLTSETLNGANPITLAYDSDRKLAGVGSMTIGRNLQNGFITNVSLGTTNEAFTYDGFGGVATHSATQSGSERFAVTYVRDELGRITQKTESVLGTSHTHAYEYDDAGRLRHVTRDGSALRTFTYDLNGNRTVVETHAAGQTATAAYDAQDRLLSFGPNSYTYNAAGDLATKTSSAGLTTYDYDTAGNLRSAVLPDGRTVAYVIDGLNRCIGKRVGGTLVQGFVYGDQLRVVAELNGSGQVVSRFAYGHRGNVPSYMIRQGATYRIISDNLGSPRLVIDVATAEVVQEMEYDEWGNVTVDTNPGFQPFGFAGGLYDRDTNLVRFGARDYDPQTGRWTAKDPIGFGGGTANVYVYVSNDPINLIDPFGLAAPGDVVFFNWSQKDWPRHAAIVTQVDANNQATRAFGAWEDTMTFHEVDLSTYNGGITKNIIGYGNMSDFTDEKGLQAFIAAWAKKPVAPNWDGTKGLVCIDVATDLSGLGGKNLRTAMAADFAANGKEYDASLGPLKPEWNSSYRRNPWLMTFFDNTGRFSRPAQWPPKKK